MLNVLLRVVAVLIAAYMLMMTFFAFMFRMDTIGELRWTLRADVWIGFWLTFAFLLARTPTPAGATWRRHAVTAVGAAFIWTVVTGSLWQTHLDQAHIRGKVPMDELIDDYLWPALLD